MSLGPLYVLFGEVSVQAFCPFFNWVVCLPGVQSCEFFICFGDQTLVRGTIGKYVFPYCWFSFYFNAVFFSHAEAFYFDEVPFVYLSFMSLITTQFTIAKCWKQPKCPSVNEWMKKLWYIYTMEYYTAERKKELLLFVTAWMELEHYVK